jgi:hypothetical protein
MKKIIDAFPKPLLQDLIEGHWLPVIGAGLSRNATVPAGKKMPLWDNLGKALSGEMSGHFSEFIYQNIGCNLLGKWGRKCS